MRAEYAVWAVLVVVNSPIFFFYGKLLFGDLQGFIDAVVFWVKPDLLSMVQGEFFDDWWAEFKLGLFVSSCIGLMTAEYYLLVKPHILPMFLPALR